MWDRKTTITATVTLEMELEATLDGNTLVKSLEVSCHAHAQKKLEKFGKVKRIELKHARICLKDLDA